jgi:hypothetical protein
MKYRLFVALLASICMFSSGVNAQLFDSQNNCFPENTRIALTKDRFVNIQDIKKGTPLLGYSSTAAKILDLIDMDAFAARAMPPRADGPRFVAITDSLGHKVIVSDNVPILIIGEGFAYVGKARVGDIIFTLDGEAKITSFQFVERPNKVFDFGMQPWNVIANKIDGFFAERILFGISALTGYSVR